MLEGEHFLMLPRSFYLESFEEKDQIQFFVRIFDGVRFDDASLYERIKSIQSYPPLCTYSFDEVIKVLRRSNLGTSRRELSTLTEHYLRWYNFSADESIQLKTLSPRSFYEYSTLSGNPDSRVLEMDSTFFKSRESDALVSYQQRIFENETENLSYLLLSSEIEFTPLSRKCQKKI